MKILIKRILASFGYQIKPLPRGKPSPIHLWEEDDCFDDLYLNVRGHTVVSQQRCFILYQLARHVASLDGHVAEIGVYKVERRGCLRKLLNQHRSICICLTLLVACPRRILQKM